MQFLGTFIQSRVLTISLELKYKNDRRVRRFFFFLFFHLLSRVLSLARVNFFRTLFSEEKKFLCLLSREVSIHRARSRLLFILHKLRVTRAHARAEASLRFAAMRAIRSSRTCTRHRKKKA